VKLSTPANGSVGILSGQVAVNPGDQVAFGGWAYLESGSGSGPGWWLAVYDGNHNYFAAVSSSPGPSSGWTYESGTYTVPSNGAYVVLYAPIYQPSASTVLRVDDGFPAIGRTATTVDNLDYLPFGEQIAGDTSTTHKFTSKERDESGLDYFGARYMSSAQGRWTSPDEANLTDARILNPSNTLNKYIYGGNNPLKYTDPDGQDITVFYTNTGPGHFWMEAYDPATRQSATLDFGPAASASRVSEVLGLDGPGDTNYAAHMPSADEIRQDYSSLTIQTNPVDTQKAINAINSANASLKTYNVYGQNCTTVCRDVLQKILGLNTNSIRPTSLWSDIFLKWSKQAQQARQQGSRAPNVQSNHGVDYGNPRIGMNTFDFVWMLLQQQKQQPPPQPKPQVTTKICYTDENGKQVCQQ
jgi:RHS repeat-associated protein